MPPVPLHIWTWPRKWHTMVRGKSKKLGKGLAALISTNSKKPRNIKDDDDEPEDIEERPTSKRTSKKGRGGKKKGRKKEELEVDDEDDEDDEEIEFEDDDEPRPKRKASSKKRKAYEKLLEERRKAKDKRYKDLAKKIDPDVEVWDEEEYSDPIDFNYFKRNKSGNPSKRYQELLDKRKK